MAHSAYGNWVGVVETVTDVVRLGLLKDDGKKVRQEKTGNGFKLLGRCRPKTLSSKKSKIGKMLKITVSKRGITGFVSGSEDERTIVP